MKGITNRAYLNRYNSCQPKKAIIQIIEPDTIIDNKVESDTICPVVPYNSPESIIENENEIEESISLTELFPDATIERIQTFKDLEPKRIPSLRLIVEKILLEKKLEKINGWILR
jgi:hypothetical protein